MRASATSCVIIRTASRRNAATRERLLALTEEKLHAITTSVNTGRLKHKAAIARRLHRWLNRWGMERFFQVSYDEGPFFRSPKEGGDRPVCQA